MTSHLDHGNVLDYYPTWPSPNTIISDGAYGIGGFPGDPRTPNDLVDWYSPHVAAWSQAANLGTTLWFWNTEIGWANVHPLLVQNGWNYEFTNIWNKGVGQIAGNVNSKTIRRFPVVTEVCVYYTRTPQVPSWRQGNEVIHMKKWLLDEWKATGLPRRKANEACGVKDAATRKYFDQGWLWYFPPVEQMMQIVEYANRYGNPQNAPFYSLDGIHPVSAEQWASFRSPWNHEHGVTNVWERPSLRGSERYKGNMQRSAPRKHKPSAMSASHLNQKPLDLMQRIISASTKPGDVVWEPFGGLCSATLAASHLGRRAYAAEINDTFFEIASHRLQNERIIL